MKFIYCFYKSHGINEEFHGETKTEASLTRIVTDVMRSFCITKNKNVVDSVMLLQNI
ncbi:hypothetical protein Phum_PHUM266170 [Pediculus humanus corporis]|uniref:Uncharacterized protein n=1 Tax=Pediculus humanus subsp. corporis TaxID=121224 RepID=E0VKJ9_PEDHC|nr:uncharacterized protein Phum_PHUM266170 [Pediculus humanus corporis]EEB13905.1 hypothetical protein Phum_PHUM266170 [Pediculus humanus corporis]